MASASAVPRSEPLGKSEHCIVARLFRQHQCSALFEIGSGERALRHFPGGLVGLNLAQGFVVTIRGVTEEDDAKHGMQYSPAVSFELARRLSAASQRWASSCSIFCSWF